MIGPNLFIVEAGDLAALAWFIICSFFALTSPTTSIRSNPTFTEVIIAWVMGVVGAAGTTILLVL